MKIVSTALTLQKNKFIHKHHQRIMSFEDQIKFSFNFLQTLNASQNSTVYSPSSILNALSLIFVASKNNTEQQIRDVIGKGKTRKEIIEYYSNFLIKYAKSDDDEEVRINVANKLFVSPSLSLLPEYITTMKTKFLSNPEALDFGNQEEAAKIINTFVSEATKEMITEVLQPDDINSLIKAAIINVVYFIGAWEDPFLDRYQADFYSDPPRKVEMMDSVDAFDWLWTSGDSWTALGIPYKHKKAWMFIILPRQNDGLQELLTTFDLDFFLKDLTTEYCTRVEATIPVMEIESMIELPENLKKLGIVDAFSPKNCDLSNMLEAGSQQQWIEKAIHKAVIKVDEKGTEASGGTAAYQQAVSVPTYFKADHPFLYFIVATQDSETIIPEDILFMGTFC